MAYIQNTSNDSIDERLSPGSWSPDIYYLWFQSQLTKNLIKWAKADKIFIIVSRNNQNSKTNSGSGNCFVAWMTSEKSLVLFSAYDNSLPFRETLYIRYIGVNPELQDKGVGLMLCQNWLKSEAGRHNQIWSLINRIIPIDKLHEKLV